MKPLNHSRLGQLREAAFDKLIFGLEEIDTISALVTVRKHSFSREAAGLSPRQIWSAVRK
jgi:hypothetical protein